MINKRVSVVALFSLLTAGTVFASDLCNVPAADRQPIEALQQKLKSEGWQIKKVKMDEGCYEVYALTDSGQRIEAYFDPKTFELIKSKQD